MIDEKRLIEVLEKNFGHTGGASVLKQMIEEQPKMTPCYLGSPCEYQNEKICLNQGWTPVSEGLPKNDTECIIQLDYGGMSIVKFYDGFNCIKVGDRVHHEFEIDNVVAWMPKPNPYQEVQDESIM